MATGAWELPEGRGGVGWRTMYMHTLPMANNIIVNNYSNIIDLDYRVTYMYVNRILVLYF